MCNGGINNARGLLSGLADHFIWCYNFCLQIELDMFLGFRAIVHISHSIRNFNIVNKANRMWDQVVNHNWIIH